MHVRKSPFPARIVLFTAVALLLVFLVASVLPAQKEPTRNEPAENRLGEESSPYLRLHADNPVDWYPWGPEAFAAARDEGKPIFLSIGYSTCHWCHVMERESFSDPEVAARMNQHFVNVKVDREERPDVDQVYMLAAQQVGGGGGWPLSIFLTPELEPFYAGTYFPPEPRRGLPGFSDVLRRIARDWERERQRVESQAELAVQRLRRALEARHRPSAEIPPVAAAEAQVEALAKLFDAAWGGFARPPVFAPKFPRPASLFLLLDVAASGTETAASDRSPRRGADAETMLAATLDRMARGGIFDQLGGGFHRYATDREWKIPHFEKMLSDQGTLLEVYARRHVQRDDEATRRQTERVIRQTVAFLDRELRADEGFYYAALDAESGGREGGTYVWNAAQLRAALGDESYRFAAPLLGFDGPPFFGDDAWVLHRPVPPSRAVGVRDLDAGLDAAELAAKLDDVRETLLAARAEWPRPRRDDKVLADWNGLVIAGLARAGGALEDDGLVEQAERAAEAVWAHLGPSAPSSEQAREEPAILRHVWQESSGARVPAYLADYAYLIHGFLELDAALANGKSERPTPWLDRAERLADEMIRRLGAEEGAGFFTAADDPRLLVRIREVSDGTRPSPNAVAVLDLVELWERTGEQRFGDEAREALRGFASRLEDPRGDHPSLARAVLRYHAVASDAASEASSPGSEDGASPPS